MPEKRGDALCQRWVHSYEEDAGRQMVFRPETFDFPMSRGRMSFELEEGGRLVRYGIGPTDKTNASPGTWKLEGNRLLLKPDAEGEPEQVFELVKSEPGILVVRK